MGLAKATQQDSWQCWGCTTWFPKCPGWGTGSCFAMNLEGRQQLLGVYPSPRGPLTSTATFLSLCTARRLHLVMSSFGNTKDSHLAPKLGTHSPCP